MMDSQLQEQLDHISLDSRQYSRRDLIESCWDTLLMYGDGQTSGAEAIDYVLARRHAAEGNEE